MKLWKSENEKWELKQTLKGHKYGVTSIDFSPNGEYLASGSIDSTVKLWSMISYQCLTEIQDFFGVVYSVAWGKTQGGYATVAKAGYGNTVQIWQISLKEKKPCQARLSWISHQTILNVAKLSIEGAEGLISMNERLLKQRKAEGTPSNAEMSVSAKLTAGLPHEAPSK